MHGEMITLSDERKHLTTGESTVQWLGQCQGGNQPHRVRIMRQEEKITSHGQNAIVFGAWRRKIRMSDMRDCPTSGECIVLRPGQGQGRNQPQRVGMARQEERSKITSHGQQAIAFGAWMHGKILTLSEARERPTSGEGTVPRPSKCRTRRVSHLIPVRLICGPETWM